MVVVYDAPTVLTIVFFLLTCLIMIISILFFPTIKIKSIGVGTYWVIVLIGTIIVVIVSGTKLSYIGSSLIEDSEINPIKILSLFISMTILSVYLDEMGFFQYLANAMLARSKSSQKKLFFYLFLMVSILTIFTSNDVIILSFTPFICYFAKNANISPMPYLTSEFVAANTWSMFFIIGNPTNIYLGTAKGITFLPYAKVMFFPTVAGGVTALFSLYLMYRKELGIEITGETKQIEIQDKTLLIGGIVHLAVCIILLAFGSYIGLEMWLVTVCAAGSLFVFVLVTSAFKRRPPVELGKTLQRAPWELIPFVLGMFIMILCVQEKGITEEIGKFLGDSFTVIKYGVLAFFACNVINNIPMTVLFAPIMAGLTGMALKQATYSTIIASNLGAYFSPIGALAGIMFASILRKFEITFGYLDFLQIGVFIALPTLCISCLVLWLMLMVL